jgi:hypothetical protein
MFPRTTSVFDHGHGYIPSVGIKFILSRNAGHGSNI